MKNFDIMAPVPLLSVGARQLRRHFHAWRDPPEIADDDKIVGLEAGADHLKIADGCCAGLT